MSDFERCKCGAPLDYISRYRALEAALDSLYSLVRKQGMDEEFRRRIEALIPAYALETQRDSQHE
jgi:hypothetical protein